MKINRRKGETWINHWGFFYNKILGIELPNGNFYGKAFK